MGESVRCTKSINMHDDQSAAIFKLSEHVHEILPVLILAKSLASRLLPSHRAPRHVSGTQRCAQNPHGHVENPYTPCGSGLRPQGDRCTRGQERQTTRLTAACQLSRKLNRGGVNASMHKQRYTSFGKHCWARWAARGDRLTVTANGCSYIGHCCVPRTNSRIN